MLTIDERNAPEDLDEVRPVPAEPAIVVVPVDVVRRRRLRWPWVVTVLAFVQYTAVGWWLILVRHWFIHDDFSRTLSAKLMTLSRDPHLGAIGFYWMPLPTITRIPFVLIMQPFGHAELAGPLTSAFFAAITIPVIVAIGRLLKQERAAMVVVAIYALSPVTMFVGADGMSESTFAFFIALTMWAFLRWRHHGTTQSLAFLGIALGMTMMCRYEAIVLTGVVGIAVALASERGNRARTSLLSVLPAVVVLAWWYVAADLIMGDGLFWWHASQATTATPPDAAWLPADRSLGRIMPHIGFLVIALAPAIIAIVAGCVSAFRRWRTSLGILGLVLVLPAVIALQVVQGSSWGAPRFFITTPLVSSIGVLWVLRAGIGQRRTYAIGVVGVVLLAVGALTGSLLLTSHTWAYCEGEYAFFGPLFGKEDVTSTVESDGPNRVFIGDMRPFVRASRDIDRELARGERVAMDSLLAVPPLLTKYPDQYVLPEDRDFEPILSDAVGRFELIVVQTGVSPTSKALLLADELRRTTGGEWQLVGDYEGVLKVFEWVATGSTPTFVGEITPPSNRP